MSPPHAQITCDGLGHTVSSLCLPQCAWSPTVVDRRTSCHSNASPLARAEPMVPLHRLLARYTAMPQTRSHATRIYVQEWMTPCAAIHLAIAVQQGSCTRATG